MTRSPTPPREPDAESAQDEALVRALFEQEFLPAPVGLSRRVLAALEPSGRRILSLPALARLAAAVLLALGTWVATTGSVPTLAYAEPSPVIQDVLAPTRELLPNASSELTSLALEEVTTRSEGVPAAALAAAGVVLVGAGLFLARRAAKEKTS